MILACGGDEEIGIDSICLFTEETGFYL